MNMIMIERYFDTIIPFFQKIKIKIIYQLIFLKILTIIGQMAKQTSQIFQSEIQKSFSKFEKLILVIKQHSNSGSIQKVIKKQRKHTITSESYADVETRAQSQISIKKPQISIKNQRFKDEIKTFQILKPRQSLIQIVQDAVQNNKQNQIEIDHANSLWVSMRQLNAPIIQRIDEQVEKNYMAKSQRTQQNEVQMRELAMIQKQLQKTLQEANNINNKSLQESDSQQQQQSQNQLQSSQSNGTLQLSQTRTNIQEQLFLLKKHQMSLQTHKRLTEQLLVKVRNTYSSIKSKTSNMAMRIQK